MVAAYEVITAHYLSGVETATVLPGHIAGDLWRIPIPRTSSTIEPTNQFEVDTA